MDDEVKNEDCSDVLLNDTGTSWSNEGEPRDTGGRQGTRTSCASIWKSSPRTSRCFVNG
ncbi:hypothetical protein Syun_009731 [Stephania yunnanensis]|uniref:Uncharacterized protein n=1 Tax=Stephania yunnanensis TaxID=152371 RepID=A0AAP0KF70_9MAGN